jgi:hypothetical protein
MNPETLYKILSRCINKNTKEFECLCRIIKYYICNNKIYIHPNSFIFSLQLSIDLLKLMKMIRFLEKYYKEKLYLSQLRYWCCLVQQYIWYKKKDLCGIQGLGLKINIKYNFKKDIDISYDKYKILYGENI